MNISLNHMVAPRLSHARFFELANQLGATSVEIRNDLTGVALLDGTPAAAVGASAKAHGLDVVSINALQRFNEWSAAREREAEALIEACVSSGARCLVMCPVNDVNYTPSAEQRRAGLREALGALKPMLAKAGIIGLVEPLGFAECSLRLKEDAVDGIEAVGGGDVFRLVHDTFHHFVAGESRMFPQYTGLVHISGVTDPAATAATMRDPHRVLVDANDRIDNIGQLRALIAGGYKGPVSLEPFAASVHDSSNIEAELRASMDYVAQHLGA